MTRAAGVLAGTTEAPSSARRWVSTFLAVAAVLCAVLGLVTATRGPAALNGAFAGGDSAADAARAAQIAITPAAGTVISPITPIAVSTDSGRIRSVAVTNAATGAAVGGKLAPDGASWQTVDKLGYASSYNVVATATGPDGAATRKTSTVATLTPASAGLPVVHPAAAAADASASASRSWSSSTTRCATGPPPQRALSVTANPPQPGGWYWLSDTEAHYRPQTYWAAGLDDHAQGRPATASTSAAGVYGETDRTETIHVHDAWVAKADGAHRSRCRSSTTARWSTRCRSASAPPASRRTSGRT